MHNMSVFRNMIINHKILNLLSFTIKNKYYLNKFVGFLDLTSGLIL